MENGGGVRGRAGEREQEAEFLTQSGSLRALYKAYYHISSLSTGCFVRVA